MAARFCWWSATTGGREATERCGGCTRRTSARRSGCRRPVLGPLRANSDWNAYWDVAATKSGRGWFAEFRIPFSTLAFQVDGGEVTMGLIAYRMISRKNERQTYPVMDPGWGRLGFARSSGAQRVVLRNVRQATPNTVVCRNPPSA